MGPCLSLTSLMAEGPAVCAPSQLTEGFFCPFCVTLAVGLSEIREVGDHETGLKP